jgi:hypothetical protein
MIKYIITLFLLFQITLISCIAQEVVPSLEFAEINYENQNYRIALKEYLRLFYFDRQNEFPEVEVNIAECFSRLHDSENAIKYYQLFLGKSRAYSKKTENVFYAFIQELIISKNYKVALSELFQVNPDVTASDSDRYYYYLGMTYLFDKQVFAADEAFQKLSYADSIDKDSYYLTIKKIEKTIKKKHRRAKIWSAILPGLGQTINGDAKDGLNSFAINGSLAIIFIQVAKSLTIGDAALTVVPWFFRFYTGGIKNAGLASKTFQSKKLNEHSATLVKLLADANRK